MISTTSGECECEFGDQLVVGVFQLWYLIKAMSSWTLLSLMRTVPVILLPAASATKRGA
jgi:hypothetical protein